MNQQGQLLIQSGCKTGEQLVSTKSEQELSYNFTIIALTITLITFVSLISYTYFSKSKNSFTNRLYKFYDTTNTKITSAVVIGILVFGVIVSFNTNIVTPFIQAMIPNYNWNRSITLRSYNTTDSSGRPVRINVEMYPSLFIQSIIAFFITLLVVFSIAEISTMISNTFLRNYINTIFKFSSMILLLLLLIWNIYERFNLTDVMVCKVPNEKVDFKVV